MEAGLDCLLVSAGSWRCALPLASVAETMRALPLSPCASVAPYVRGVSVIRGSATVVLDLACLLGGSAGSCRRFVLLRTSDRPVALGVDALEGILSLSEAELLPLRSLLTPLDVQVAALGSLDGDLVALLHPTLLLPEALGAPARHSEAPPP